MVEFVNGPDTEMLRKLGPPPDDRKRPTPRVGSFTNKLCRSIRGLRPPYRCASERSARELSLLEAYFEEVWPLLRPVLISDVIPLDRADLIRELAARGLDVEQGPEDASPLQMALVDNDLEAARALLEAGADPNGREDPPLASARSAEAVALLVGFGADVHRSVGYGHEPLTVAILRGSKWEPEAGIVACRALLAAGADPWAISETGDSLSTTLASMEHPDAAALLAEIGERPVHPPSPWRP